MTVHFPPHGTTVQPAHMAQKSAAADVKTPTGRTYIDALAEDNFTAKAEGSGHLQPQGKQVSPAQVRQNLLRVLDDLPLDLSQILIAVRKNAQEISKINVLLRDMGSEARIEQMQKSADDTEKAGDFRLTAGLIQGVTQAAMAGTQIASSAQAATATAQGMDTQKQGQALQQDATNLNATATQLESQAQHLETTAATSGSAAVAEHPAADIEKNLAATPPARVEADMALQIEEQIQPTPSAQEPASTEILDGTSLAEKSPSGAKTPSAAATSDTAHTEGNPTRPARQDPTPEQMKAHASILRKHADNLKVEAAAKFDEVKEINATAEGIRSKWESCSKLLDGLIAQPLITYQRFQAETSDSDSKRHEIEAKQQEIESKRAGDAIHSANQIGQDALQKLDSVIQAQSETIRAIQRNSI